MPVAPAKAFGQPAVGATLQLGEACWLGQCICGCGTTGTCQHHMCRKLLFNAPGWLFTLTYCNLWTQDTALDQQRRKAEESGGGCTCCAIM